MKRLIAVVVAAGLLAAACGDDDDTSTSSDSKDSSDNGDSDKIEWKKCKADVECADVEVPLDYDKPDGDKIKISVTRSKATGDRIGPLFINPGGPGSTAGDLVDQFANLMPSPVHERFDVIGVDPRGTGSSKLDCDFDMTKLFGVDPYVQTEYEEDDLTEVNVEYVDQCKSKVGDQLAHMGTRDAARDIDHVRGLLGDEKMSYMGFSYGTILGQVLAEEFPDKLRAMVLDGAQSLGATGLDSANTQATSFETALQAFAADCNAKPDCPIAPDAMGAVDKLLATTEQTPVAAKPRDLGPGEMATGLSYPLYSEDLWEDLAKAVADGNNGDGTAMVKLSDQYLAAANFDLYYAVNCIDFAWPTEPDGVLDAAAAAAPAAPHFGFPVINEYLECALWPEKQDPLKPVTSPISPQVLVVATTDDPATPYEEGVKTAEQTGGVLLTHQGEGHTIVGQGDQCIDNAVTAYLVDGTLPAAGTTCQ